MKCFIPFILRVVTHTLHSPAFKITLRPSAREHTIVPLVEDFLNSILSMAKTIRTSLENTNGKVIKERKTRTLQ